MAFFFLMAPLPSEPRDAGEAMALFSRGVERRADRQDATEAKEEDED